MSPTGGAGEPANSAIADVVDGPLVAPVIARLVGMMGARAACPVDRLDNVLLIADALGTHVARFAADGRVHLRIETDPGTVSLVLGPLTASGQELLEAARLPGVGDVVQALADRIDFESGPDGEWMRVGIDFDAASAA